MCDINMSYPMKQPVPNPHESTLRRKMVAIRMASEYITHRRLMARLVADEAFRDFDAATHEHLRLQVIWKTMTTPLGNTSAMLLASQICEVQHQRDVLYKNYQQQLLIADYVLPTAPFLQPLSGNDLLLQDNENLWTKALAQAHAWLGPEWTGVTDGPSGRGAASDPPAGSPLAGSGNLPPMATCLTPTPSLPTIMEMVVLGRPPSPPADEACPPSPPPVSAYESYATLMV